MRFGPFFGSTIIVICMILFQWPKLNHDQKKEKTAFIVLTGLGWLLINFLFIFPNTPGPTEIIDFLYKPLGKLLE
jgi:multisubunit Na+/H+ antiporter MnhB subunit